MDIDWAKEINKLTGPFPEVGKDIPELEIIHKDKAELEDLGDFSKLTTILYFFVDKETGKTYTYEKHWMIEYGEVSLRDAIEVIKKFKKS